MIFFGKKKKAVTVKVEPSNYVFEVQPNQTVLQAALESGLQYPHDCRRGSCGKCKTRLLKGEIKEQTDFAYALTAQEMDEGIILACSALPKTPLLLDVELISNERTLGCTSCEGTIIRYQLLTKDILEIGIRVNKSLNRSGDSCKKCAPYVAGQFADISIAGISQSRSYSFARARENEQDNEVSFLIRHIPNGEMSGWFHAKDRTGEKLQLSGPYGSFYLHEGDGTILCIAGGSGMSSINALLEHACSNKVARDVIFLFGARSKDQLFYLDKMDQLKKKWPKKHSFSFIQVLSDDDQNKDWHGLGGLVTDNIENLKLDLSSCQAYLSGPPEMIDAAIQKLNKEKLVN